MIKKGQVVFGTLAALALSAIGCSDTADPVAPPEPRFVKPVRPPSTPPVELLDFYIYQNGEGQNFVHILATGDIPSVNLNVVQDYFFNGIRDGSLHYEYTTLAPRTVAVADLFAQGLGEIDEETGGIHLDIPWNGENLYRDSDGSLIDTFFPDFPHVGLNGTADPYTFDVRFLTEEGESIGYYWPQGIMIGGDVVGTLEMPRPAGHRFHSEVAFISSYATYAGSEAGSFVFIDEITLDETSLSCSVSTIRERIDGVKVTRAVTRVSGSARVVLASTAGSGVPDGWLEVHVARQSGDPQHPTLESTFSSTPSADGWANGWGFSATLDGAYPSLEFQLAVDYVFAQDMQTPSVYDPSLNSNSGFTTLNASGISSPGSWPIALTGVVTVDCVR